MSKSRVENSKPHVKIFAHGGFKFLQYETRRCDPYEMSDRIHAFDQSITLKVRLL